MQKTPYIDYPHVLNELSINRQDPCEVIRELVSNSYDAKAENMYYWPLYGDNEENGFIYFGDGIGLSMEENEEHGLSPYEAFFSIGKTTKRKGEGVGYKCQGSKLCFACNQVTIITKCKGEKQWRYFDQSQPRRNLGLETDISPKTSKDPFNIILESIDKFNHLDVDLQSSIKKAASKESFKSGLMIIVQGLDVEDFSKYFDPIQTHSSTPSKNKHKWSYLYNYIRLYTKHADVCRIEGNFGFAETSKEQFKSLTKTKPPSFQLWADSELIQVPSGYWYLKSIDESDAASPLEVSSLRHASFRDRFAVSFEHNRKVYQIVLAIDGKKRALGDKRAESGYFSLGRQGNSYSGIRLTDVRGAFLSSQGVKISSITEELFQNSQLSEKYGVLGDALAQDHYTLVINGSFDVVTNRNSPASSAIKLISSSGFMRAIKSNLDSFYESSLVFRELIQRLDGDTQSNRIEKELQKTRKLKQDLPKREKFRIRKSKTILDDKWFACPGPGEENWVGVLYSMLSVCLPNDMPLELERFWLRPMNFSNVGFDAVAQKIGINQIAKQDDLKIIEYKLSFSNKYEYNHPLAKTDIIVAWDIEAKVIDGKQSRITDEYGCTGDIIPLGNYSYNQAYLITNIRTENQHVYGNQVIAVSLKWLLGKTYDNIEFDDHAAL